MLPKLLTPRLVLRAFTPEDRVPFRALNADPEVMRFFPATLDAAESDALADRIDEDLRVRGLAPYAVEVRGGPRFVGVVGLSVPRFDAPFTPCVELAYRLAREAWGHGYATEAATRVLEVAFDELDLDEVVAFTTTSNAPSRRVMERVGMAYDPNDDFDHPSLPVGHPLRRHVLYRRARPR